MPRRPDLCPPPRAGFGSARRFADAITYLRAHLDAGGRAAIDYERRGSEPRVDNWCPRGEHPLLYEIGELEFARRILTRAARKLGPAVWLAWGAHRLDGWSLRRIGDQLSVTHTTARRYVLRGDALIETLLDDAGRLKPRENKP